MKESPHRIQTETHPFGNIHTAVCYMAVICQTVQYRCESRTRAAACWFDLRPKADFPNCLFLCLRSPKLELFHTALLSMPESNRTHKNKQKTGGCSAPPQHLLKQCTVGSGLPLIQMLAGTRGELVLSSDDKLQGELEEKQAASSEEQCGIELFSAGASSPHAAGMSCALRSMNGGDCLNFSKISFHILIMYSGYSLMYTDKCTLLRHQGKVVFRRTQSLPSVCLFPVSFPVSLEPFPKSLRPNCLFRLVTMPLLSFVHSLLIAFVIL